MLPACEVSFMFPRLPLRALLPVLFFLYALNFMDRSALGVLGGAIQADMGLSDAGMGLLHSALLISLPLLILPAAALNDIAGRRRMLSLAAALWSGAMTLAGCAAGLVSFGTARFTAGVNEAFTGAGASSWLAAMYPPSRRGKVLGLFFMCLPAGMALGTFTGSLSLGLTGSWRSCFYLLAACGLLTALLVPLLPDAQPRIRAGAYAAGIALVLRSRTLLLTGLGAAMYNIILYSYQSWTPTLLARAYGQEAGGTTGPAFAVMLLAGAIGAWAGGLLADRWQRRRRDGRVFAAMAAVLIMAFFKLLFYLCAGRVGYGPACVIGVVDGMFSILPMAVLFSIVQDVAPEEYRSLSVGVMGTISFLAGGAWGPLLTGMLSAALGEGAAGMGAALALSALAALPACCFLYGMRASYVAECLAAARRSSSSSGE